MRFLSLFSGIEAASVAWCIPPLSWECAAVAEIDKFPCAVLKHRYPDVPNLGNVCAITREHLSAVGPVDAIVFGFPCQDLSVAGKRAGLKGARSGLFFEAMRIVEICRELWGTRWTIAENVPGLFSSNSGADFAAVVGTLVGAKFAVPKGRWQNTGVALGPLGLVEWSVLDAQWFGVPQRRRRVFLVRDSGDWRSRPPVLSFPESLSGYPPPRRETREDLAPCLSARTHGGGGLGTDFDCDGDLIQQAFGGNNTSGPIDTATACNAHGGSGRMDFESETLVTHALRADGFDAGEDGTGRGTPLVPVAFVQNTRDEVRLFNGDGQTVGALAAEPGAKQQCYVAFDCKASGRNGFGVGEISPTLRGMGHKDTHQNGGGQVAVAVNLRGRAGGAMPECSDVASVRAASGGSSRSYVAQTAVRRLTPREYERLQGFPDDYTKISAKTADGPRYKALGNSFAVSVVRWIGKRLLLANLFS